VGRLDGALGLNVAFSLLTLFPGTVGGSEAYVRGLMGEFAGGIGPERVTVLANRQVASAYADAASKRVTVQRVRSYRAGRSMPTRALAMAAARALPRLAARDVPAGLDVVHFPVTVPIPRLAGVPSVVTIHDLQHHELPELFSRAELAYRRWAYDDAARSATRVVTISEHTRASVIERLGVDEARVETIHLGVDLERFSPGEAADPQLDRLDLPERFLLYPANLWRHKNHLRLLEALAGLADREVGLVLTGQPYRRGREVMGRARELGVERRVHHVGFVPSGALPALYRRADALVFPSLAEGFGLPPLEAMACGCPVAAATSGSLPEVCGDAALLFDPRDVDSIGVAIDRVLGDAALRDELTERGVRRAREFSWAEAARRHGAAYERAAEG
jgi:glycosyltransferase involved in cell wall biosynthesis